MQREMSFHFLDYTVVTCNQILIALQLSSVYTVISTWLQRNQYVVTLCATLATHPRDCRGYGNKKTCKQPSERFRPAVCKFCRDDQTRTGDHTPPRRVR